jgi:hypothetical protein
MAAALLATLPACDQEWSSAPTDATVDTSAPDVTPDAVPDVADEPEPEAEPDTGPACTYPPPPHSFNSVGAIAPPSAWPSSIRGSAEISTLEHADFEAFFCDPEVQSIIVFVATPS